MVIFLLVLRNQQLLSMRDYKIDDNNNINNSPDSRTCIICQKSEPRNKFLLCPKCKYNLTYITCANLEISNLNNFVSLKCENK